MIIADFQKNKTTGFFFEHCNYLLVCTKYLNLWTLIDSKAMLSQVNREPIPSLSSFVNKKAEIDKTNPTFVISVLKIDITIATIGEIVGLVFTIFNLFY